MIDMEPSTAAPGLLSSLRALSERLLSAVLTRFELLSVELQEEKYRLLENFLLLGAVLVTGLLALMFGSVLVIAAFWDSARLIAIGGVAVFYGGVAGGLYVLYRRRLKRAPRPFSATMAALQEDKACLPNDN